MFQLVTGMLNHNGTTTRWRNCVLQWKRRLTFSARALRGTTTIGLVQREGGVYKSRGADASLLRDVGQTNAVIGFGWQQSRTVASNGEQQSLFCLAFFF